MLSKGGGFGKIVTLFGADMSSPVHIDNKKKDILILGKGLTNGSDDTTLTVENCRDCRDMSMIFQLVMIVLLLIMFLVSINI